MEGHLIPAPTATSRFVRTISVDSLLARPDVSELVGAAWPIVLSVDIEGPDLMVGPFVVPGQGCCPARPVPSHGVGKKFHILGRPRNLEDMTRLVLILRRRGGFRQVS